MEWNGELMVKRVKERKTGLPQFCIPSRLVKETARDHRCKSRSPCIRGRADNPEVDATFGRISSLFGGGGETRPRWVIRNIVELVRGDCGELAGRLSPFSSLRACGHLSGARRLSVQSQHMMMPATVSIQFFSLGT